MEAQRASQTASGTAYLRAAHQLLDGTPLVFEDPAALSVLEAGAHEAILAARDRYDGPGARALRSHVVLRARYAEDRLAIAAARGVTQYVLLGAGLDTFALRQPDWATTLRIIEVDHPDTQRVKRARVAALGRDVPPNVHFVACDLETDDFAEALAMGGVRPDAATFVSWLGGTMYLTAPTIARVLRVLAQQPAGSETVLTYLPPAADGSTFGATLAARTAALGEPMITTFTDTEMAAALTVAGFSSVTFLQAADSARYFPATGVLQNPSRVSIVSARREPT